MTIILYVRMLNQIPGVEGRIVKMWFICQGLSAFPDGSVVKRRQALCIGLEIDIVFLALTCLDNIRTFGNSLNYQKIFDLLGAFLYQEEE